ncbi:MAG: histidine phosphatase family protein [Gammaproteobacteria bacterium]|nr:histidine phosphatase family protein [Gammaproteobacteria bacterium]
MQNGKTDPDRRRKRRRRRLQVIVIYTAIAVGLAWFFESQATTTMIFVRHAEKALIPVDDPVLSEQGKARAAELARQLVDADVVAGVDAIYSTNTQRTMQTARPTAEALGLEILNYQNADDDEPVVDAMVRAHKGKIILVVGHSDTLPTMIAALGASKKVPPIAEGEYDNLYLISIPWFGKTKTIRLRYGEPYTGAPATGEPTMKNK